MNSGFMEHIPSIPLRPVWLKAAVAGSLWASVEIILGSFLHNLRIPFSGAILSFFGVYLVISFFQLWKESGWIWRAGLICALMKSISPSAIIFGPMIGIFSEALLMEVFIFLFGKNLLGYLTGGAFAVFSSLLQKVVNLLILFGFNFVEILKSLYEYFKYQTGMETINLVSLLLLIPGIYFLAGMSAAVMGYHSGTRYLCHRKIDENPLKIEGRNSGVTFSAKIQQDYSLYFLALAVAAMTGCLLLLNAGFINMAMVTAFAFLGFCIYRYGRSLRRLMKLSLWLQFIMITFLAAFLWNRISGRAFFSLSGLAEGLKMIFRAIIVITGFAAISIELRNPLIKSLLYKKGFTNLYHALSLSFSALPGIISAMPKAKEILKAPFRFFSHFLQQSEGLLRQFETDYLSRPPIVIISGEIHEGKTTFTHSVVQELQKKGYRVSGFLAFGTFEAGQRSAFSLFDIQTSEVAELCSRQPHPGWQQKGPFYFNPIGLDKGAEWLSIETLGDAQLVVVDEVGPFELSNQGWVKQISRLCECASITHLWIVRKSLVAKIARNWSVGDVFIFDINRDNKEVVLSKLEELIGAIS